MFNSTLGMDIWIGMAESAWICPECETISTHKQGKGRQEKTHGQPGDKIHIDSWLEIYVPMAGQKSTNRLGKFFYTFSGLYSFCIFILGYGNI